MKASNLFSLVLPTFNVERYVERCLRSLQNQTFKDFEMIFVDDCGEDSSIEIISSYAEDDERIRIISNEQNMGTYHARRVGVEQAKGEYIIFIDPDDQLDSQFLGVLAEQVTNHSPEIIFYDHARLPKRRWFQSQYRLLPFDATKPVSEGVFKKKGRGFTHITLGTPGKAYRKSIIQKIYELLNVDLTFRYIFSEDTLLLLTGVLQNPTYKVLPFKGYLYHDNPTSATSDEQMKARAVLMADQLTYTANVLQTIVEQSDLSEQAQRAFMFYLQKDIPSQINFILRFEKGEYFKRMKRSVQAVPGLRNCIRIGLYLVSFGKIQK